METTDKTTEDINDTDTNLTTDMKTTDTLIIDPFLYDTTTIAKDYDWSYDQLLDQLEYFCIIYVATYYPTKRWAFHRTCPNKGYADTQIETVVAITGEVSDVPIITKWTQKGKEFIYQTLKEHGILPVNEVKSPLESETTPDCLKQGFHQEALLSNYVFIPTATPFGMGFRLVYLPNSAPENKPDISSENQKRNDAQN